MKLVIVNWVDSNLIHGWRPVDDNQDKIADCETVGFLVKDDDEKIVLAMSRSTDDNVLETISIPQRSVLDTRDLRLR